MRNSVPGGHHYLSLRLVGTRCNRDAIGARVELVLMGSPERKLIRTVRAGDGFDPFVKRPDLREAMIKSGSRLCILAHNEFTTDQPEFEWLAEASRREFPDVSPKDYIDARARGMGGSSSDPYCTCAEENLLAYSGDPYSTECILIHEFAHNIHLRGMSNVDPTFDGRLQAAYDSAMKAGLWKGKYASTNHHTTVHNQPRERRGIDLRLSFRGELNI